MPCVAIIIGGRVSIGVSAHIDWLAESLEIKASIMFLCVVPLSDLRVNRADVGINLNYFHLISCMYTALTIFNINTYIFYFTSHLFT